MAKPTPWKPGDEITAARLNELMRAAVGSSLPEMGSGKSTISTGSDQVDRTPRPVRLEWVRLTEWIGPTPHETPSSSDFADRTAVIQWLNPATAKFEDTDPEIELDIITDPTASKIYAEGSIIQVHVHWTGRATPISGHLVTVSGILDEALDPESDATLSIHWKNGTGDYEDTAINVEVRASPLLPAGESIPVESWVVAVYFPSRGDDHPAYWEMIQASCDPVPAEV